MQIRLASNRLGNALRQLTFQDNDSYKHFLIKNPYESANQVNFKPIHQLAVYCIKQGTNGI